MNDHANPDLTLSSSAFELPTFFSEPPSSSLPLFSDIHASETVRASGSEKLTFILLYASGLQNIQSNSE